MQIKMNNLQKFYFKYYRSDFFFKNDQDSKAILPINSH